MTGAVSRFLRHAVPAAQAKWGEQLARIPWTPGELKKHMKARYILGERKAIALLASQESMASAIFTDLNLTRTVIKEAFKKLQKRRGRQVVLARILCATRFKLYEEGGELLRPNVQTGAVNQTPLNAF